MHPPAGRLKIGDRVRVPGGAVGHVVAEHLLATNGAWRYTVALEGGGSAEHLDFELTLAA